MAPIAKKCQGGEDQDKGFRKRRFRRPGRRESEIGPCLELNECINLTIKEEAYS